MPALPTARPRPAPRHRGPSAAARVVRRARRLLPAATTRRVAVALAVAGLLGGVTAAAGPAATERGDVDTESREAVVAGARPVGDTAATSSTDALDEAARRRAALAVSRAGTRADLDRGRGRDERTRERWAHPRPEPRPDRERVPSDPRKIARQMLPAYGWDSSQFGCLNQLWIGESNWDHQATNPTSGAYGIPQSLPPTKMASAGPDWRTNPATQIEWGLEYIFLSYGTPCSANDFKLSNNWY